MSAEYSSATTVVGLISVAFSRAYARRFPDGETAEIRVFPERLHCASVPSIKLGNVISSMRLTSTQKRGCTHCPSRSRPETQKVKKKVKMLNLNLKL